MRKTTTETPPHAVPESQYGAIRYGAALSDRSDRGKVEVKGPDAIDFLQGLVTNDVASLAPRQGCYAAMLNHKGKIQSDLRVLNIPGQLLLITEPVALEAVLKTATMLRVGYQVEILDHTGELALISVIGPKATEVVGAAVPERVHSSVSLDLAGVTVIAIVAVHGAPAIDLILPGGDRETALSHLVDAGAVPVEEAVTECVRIEAGIPRYGIDMTTDTMTQEAGINEQAVSFTKGCYVGQEPVARLHHRGRPNRHLRGLVLDDLAPPQSPVVSAGKQVGWLTSVTVSPSLGPIALGMIRREINPGDRVEVSPPGIAAEVTELPFGRTP